MGNKKTRGQARARTAAVNYLADGADRRFGAALLGAAVAGTMGLAQAARAPWRIPAYTRRAHVGVARRRRRRRRWRRWRRWRRRYRCVRRGAAAQGIDYRLHGWACWDVGQRRWRWRRRACWDVGHCAASPGSQLLGAESDYSCRAPLFERPTVISERLNRALPGGSSGRRSRR